MPIKEVSRDSKPHQSKTTHSIDRSDSYSFSSHTLSRINKYNK